MDLQETDRRGLNPDDCFSWTNGKRSTTTRIYQKNIQQKANSRFLDVNTRTHAFNVKLKLKTERYCGQFRQQNFYESVQEQIRETVKYGQTIAKNSDVLGLVCDIIEASVMFWRAAANQKTP